jgi:hypothetical protein
VILAEEATPKLMVPMSPVIPLAVVAVLMIVTLILLEMMVTVSVRYPVLALELGSSRPELLALVQETVSIPPPRTLPSF